MNVMMAVFAVVLALMGRFRLFQQVVGFLRVTMSFDLMTELGKPLCAR